MEIATYLSNNGQLDLSQVVAQFCRQLIISRSAFCRIVLKNSTLMNLPLSESQVRVGQRFPKLERRLNVIYLI